MQHVVPMDEAVRLARQILAGEIEPNVGCDSIAAIGKKNNYPTKLLQFMALSHEQHGHENLGITAASCVPSILEACRELVAAQA